MRFKIDENLPPEVTALLRQEGHEAVTVFDQGSVGPFNYAVIGSEDPTALVGWLPTAVIGLFLLIVRAQPCDPSRAAGTTDRPPTDWTLLRSLFRAF